MTDREDLTKDEIDGAVSLIKSCARTAMLLPVETARALVQQNGREETLLPLLDPTLYNRTHHQTRWHRAYLSAFLDFRQALENIAKEEGVTDRG